MTMRSLRPSRPRVQRRVRRGMCLDMEGLEPRVLLYAALGDQWTYDSRITYSLMPDGTSVGGMPSVLFQTLNARFPTATWEKQIEAAASQWENVTGVNFALVSDGGQTDGTSGDQQDDPRFGDIRIGMVPLSSSVLAVTFLPPPANGGTDAGDILLNSNVNWRIGSSYDLMTVVAHEFGHTLGLGESSVSNAVMYGTYNGIKQALATDDVSGVQSIYGTRQFDQFNTGSTRNFTYQSATNINVVHEKLAGRHSEAGYHHRRGQRVVLRERSGFLLRDHDCDDTVEQSEPLITEGAGLQLVAEPACASRHAGIDGGDGLGQHQCAARAGILHQGPIGGRTGTDRRLRAARQFRVAAAGSDRTAKYDGRPATGRSRRNVERECPGELGAIPCPFSTTSSSRSAT